jgi:predicted nucleic acid-binding protein
LEPAGHIHIPLAVQLELIRLRPEWSRQKPEWVEVLPLESSFTEDALGWLQAGLLDLGESEALALASQIRADWFLTDDAAARMIAQQQGFEVHGSLGVVLWAAVEGHLDQESAEEALAALSRSSLWLSARVLTEAKSALRQIFA